MKGHMDNTSLFPSDTTIALITLGRMIQELRRRRRLTGKQFAEKIFRSQPYISKLENGQAQVSRKEIEDILDTLNASDLEKASVISQYELTKESVESYRFIKAYGVENKQREILSYEKNAVLVEEFQTSLIPGLLQIPDYSRAILRKLKVHQNSIEPTVEERTKRGHILTHSNRRFKFLLIEQLLYSMVGSLDTQLSQLEWLRMCLSKKNVELGIIPTKSGCLPTALTGFIIYNRSFVTTETVVCEQTFKDPKDVAVYFAVFSELAELAVYRDEAASLIEGAKVLLETNV